VFSKVHVVINPASGQPEPILNTLNDVFHPADIDWSVSVTRASGDATRAARGAADGGTDLVAAYGGDGTAMEVAEGLIDTGVPMAILPGGTANVMSQELGISRKLANAARLIATEKPRIRKVDLGRIGDRLFLLRALVGFEATRQLVVDREMKNTYGVFAYQIGFVRALQETERFRCRAVIDDEVIESPAATVNIYNSANIGIPGISVLPATVDDGCLDILGITAIDTRHVVEVARSLLQGDTTSEFFVHRRTRHVVVECDPPQPVTADGEDLGTTPLEVAVVPGAARIIVSLDD
jgi:diacylglycerol kinase (ATP)